MDATLTGRDAAQAIGLYMRLGASGSRFDAAKVSRAVRSSAGRARVFAALTLTRIVRPAATPRARRSSVAPRASRVAAAAASPGRPSPRGEG